MGRFAVASGSRVQKFEQKFGNLVYAGGGAPNINLPQDNYTTAVRLVSLQTVTSGATIPVIAGYGAWGPIGNITISGPSNRHPVALQARYLEIYNQVRLAPYASNLTSDPLTASTTTTWVTPLDIPLTISPTSTLGAVYTGDDTITLNLKLNNFPATQVFSTVNSATIQGSWDVWRTTFSAPAPDQPGGWLNDISFYHELAFQTTTQLKNGATDVLLPLNTDYVRVFLFFYTGSVNDSTYAPADGLYTTIDVVVNNKIHIGESRTEADIRQEMAHRYDQVLPAGTAVIDWYGRNDSRRDVIPTDPPDVTGLKLTIASTSNNNFVDVITETMSDSPFATKWIASAAAQAAQPAAA
jgi:hypothetical protein